MDIQEIFENAKNDPSLFSSIDIDELLDNIENETTEYLENKTLADISKMVHSRPARSRQARHHHKGQHDHRRRRGCKGRSQRTHRPDQDRNRQHRFRLGP